MEEANNPVEGCTHAKQVDGSDDAHHGDEDKIGVGRPILNTAGLGSSDGMRPFRYFARPIEFAPRAAIRLQITEVSEFSGELHVSLQGYKTLGGTGTPTAVGGSRRPRRRMRP